MQPRKIICQGDNHKKNRENFQEVQTHADKVSWMKAMQEEMHSLLKNDTYELVELPKGRKALRNK